MTRKDYILLAKAIKEATTLDAYGDEIVHKGDLIDQMLLVYSHKYYH